MPETTSEEKILNEHQAAEYLGFRPRALQTWRHRGGGPKYVRVHRNVRYRLSDLNEWLEGKVFTSTSQESAESFGNSMLSDQVPQQ